MLEKPVASLLRRIALGLPLTPVLVAPWVPALGGCACEGPCLPRREVVTLTAEQTNRALGADGVADFAECASMCEEVLPVWGTGTFGDGGRYTGNVQACSVSGVGTATMECTYWAPCGGGRPPLGLRPALAAGTPVARWLSASAHLEAASVAAFVELARELRLHGAPAILERAALRAAGDEARHARAVAALARAAGGEVPAVVRDEVEPRDLPSLLEADLVDGCILEAFAALGAAWQAQAAPDATVRRTVAGIAADEARHALLSFAIADWASDRVAPGVARRAEEKRHAACSELVRACQTEPSSALAVLGLPDASRAVDLARELF